MKRPRTGVHGMKAISCIFLAILLAGCASTSSPDRGIGQDSRTEPRGAAPRTAEHSLARLAEPRFVPMEPERNELVWHILKKHSPDAFAMVSHNVNRGGSVTARTTTVSADGSVKSEVIVREPFFAWIDSSAPLLSQVLSGLPVAVHEENHRFTSEYPNDLFKEGRVDPGLRNIPNGKGDTLYLLFNSYYLDRDTVLPAIERWTDRSIPIAEAFPAFPARDMAGKIPADARIGRYKNYIDLQDPTSSASTQVNGISGLMDEYNSYYWSVKVLYDMYGYLAEEGSQNAAMWHAWMEAIAKYYYSWAEFRLFIAGYLLHAEENAPDVYRSLLDDRSLRLAFTEIDDRFSSLVSELFHRWTVELPGRLAASGIPFRYRIYGPEAYWEIKEPSADPPGLWKTYFNTMRLTWYAPFVRAMRSKEFSGILDDFRLRPYGGIPVLDLGAIRIPERAVDG